MPEGRKNNSLGLLLKDLLHERSLSMRKLSELTEIDTATISRISNGKRKATLHHLQKFADSLDVPMKELVEAAGYPIGQGQEKLQSDIHTSVDIIQGFLASSTLFDQKFSIDRVEQELVSYGKWTETIEGKDAIFSNFEKKLLKVDSIGPFISKLKELFERFCSGKGAPRELVSIGSALLYFIVTLDVIPDYIFPIGYLDDAIGVKLVVKSLSNKDVAIDA